MNVVQNLKRRSTQVAVFTSATVLPVLAFAEGGNIWDSAVTDIGGLKAGIVAIGAVVLTLAIAKVSISIIRSAISKAG